MKERNKVRRIWKKRKLESSFFLLSETEKSGVGPCA